MRFHTYISFKSVDGSRGNKLWFVTYDGRVLGDSRPFETADKAQAEALRIVEAEPLVNGVRRYLYRPA